MQIQSHLNKLCIKVVFSSVLGFLFLLLGCSNKIDNAIDEKSSSLKIMEQSAVIQPEEVLTVEEEYPHVLSRNDFIYTYLTGQGVSSFDVIEMVKASKPVKDLSRLRPGVRFHIEQDEKKDLLEVKFRFSPLEKLELKKGMNGWQVKEIKEKIDIKLVSYLGKVNSTLWESARAADMNPYLIVAMAEIFGWEVDFNREVRVGDSWRITAEEKLVNGVHVGWGSVLAAEFINAGTSHKAVLFRNNDEEVGYYTTEGENLRKMFLKSPLKFGRVTSRFNRRRFHPRLKIFRAHNGVDYGAPIGTPVRSVADGVVTFARYSGGGGKVLKVRHNSTYKTAYKHLSRYGKNIRKGSRVKQGQIVAYTGNTGLSTGPHLHYEFFKNGRYVDPLRQKFPSAEPVAFEFKELFAQQSVKMIAKLPSWNPKNFITPGQKTWAEHLTPKVQEYFCLKLDPQFWSFEI